MARRNSFMVSPRTPPIGSPSKTISPVSCGMRCISSRASVDLPQPDSPTTPSVSPFMTEKETPSTALTWPCARLRKPPLMGKCFFRSVTVSIGWAGPPRSRGSPSGTGARAGGVVGLGSVLLMAASITS